jgi:Tol biopolymer transport system component
MRRCDPGRRAARAARNRNLQTRLAPLLACCILTALAPSAAAATRYDPSLRFRSITTPHFVLHYHQGEEAEALRLSLIVERVHADLSARMGHAPKGRTHVVLVDQADDPNGWSTPLPYNLIEITATPPSGASVIGNTSDWQRMVFTHEYAHVLHLDPARGWATLARRIFGRVPFAFPNLTLPLWQIEGIATFEESRGGEGRVPAGDFHGILRQAARAGSFEPLDRVNGGLVDWPSGNGWYAYGAYFHEYLARRFGEERLADLSRRTAGRLPYFGSTAFKAVYGRSLGSLWREFAREEAARTPAARGGAGIVRLTHHGFIVDGPRFDRDGTILYSRRDAHGFPSLNRIPPSGGASRRLVSRYGGEQVGITDTAIYFDQLEVRHSVQLSADVYRFDRHTGTVRRLTNGARLTDLDVSPDGRRVAAVHVSGGARTLMVLDRQQLDAGRPAFAAHAANAGDRAGVVFASPRWSPDGQHIAVERRLRGGPSEIVLVDPETQGVTVVVSTRFGRNVRPVWTPDGGALLFASDRGGGPFDLYRLTLAVEGQRVAAGALERLTEQAGGATAPDVSPDGRTVVFVGYTADGYDLFQMPLVPVANGYAEVQADAAGAPLARGSPAPPTAAPPGANPEPPSPYRPWSTVVPRAWLPVIETGDHETRAGAAAAGTDALGYHAWAATVTWSVAREAMVEPVAAGARPDLLLGYAYDRWRPTFFTQYSDETTPLLMRESDAAERRPVALRERSVDAGVVVPFRRVRWSQSVLASWRREHDALTGPSDEGTFDRGALRLGWSLNTARRYGYSISPEGGVTAGVGVELATRGLGGDGNAQLYRADTRAFLPLGRRHGVLALRGSGVASRGDPIVRRTLRLGGHDADGSVLSFDEDASSLLRGFPADAFIGTTVVLGNAEYRLPLAYVQRGLGTWPLFLRALHVSGFVDAGQAWTDRVTASDTKLSWGTEGGADATAGYALPFTWVIGVAWGRDPSGGFPDNREVYVRFGRGF